MTKPIMTAKERVDNQPVDIDLIPEPVHPAKSTRVANFIAAAALVFIAIALSFFISWSVASTNTLEIMNNPFPARVVQDSTGNTGGIVFLKVNYCKNKAIDGTVRMSYISKSREVFLPIAPERLPVGCENKEIPVIVPLNLINDSYRIKFHLVYDINPIKQNVASDFESQPIVLGKPVTE